jgi:DNA repair exonuclease SbcCD ATPase subunit
MKLVKLTAENFLRLHAVEITPDGAVVQISGANGSGKSSVLNALVCALAGKDAVPADPVRHGAEEAVIVADLGDIIVRRVIRPDRSTALTVTNKDGFKASSPQKLLEGLFGKLLDPVAFSRMPAKEQRELMADMAGLSDMLDTLWRADEADRTARRDLNRDLKAAQARLDAMPAVAFVVPVDVSATLAEIRQAREHNTAVALKHRELEVVRRDIQLDRDNITQSLEAIERLRAEIAEIERSIVDLEQTIAEGERIIATAEVPEPIDLTPLEQRLEQAEQINAQARAFGQRQALAGEVAELAQASQHYTDALAQREAERKAVIEAAASTAEQLRVSAAIAMALSPKLRVLIVREGSLLDSQSLRMLAQMAAEKDFVVLCETVDETGTVGVYIEDGAVAAVNGVTVGVAS